MSRKGTRSFLFKANVFWKILSLILCSILFSSFAVPALASSPAPAIQIGTSSITISVIDSSANPLRPSVLILYDASYTEKARGAPIIGNSYTFLLLPAGTYTVEAYIDDMFVGSVSSISVSTGGSVSKTLTVSWSKASFTLTAFYSDGITPLSNAFVTVYSYNGQSGYYNTVTTGMTDSYGKANFLLWPTTLSAEKYKVVISQLVFDVAVNDQVKVSKYGTTNLKIVTSAIAPQATGTISFSVLDSTGEALIPSVLILYNSNYVEKERGYPLITNSYTFSSLPTGSYNIEAYIDDMYIGAVGNIVVEKDKTTSRTLQVAWAKQNVIITAYCKDKTTPLNGALITISSWNGQNSIFTPRGVAISDAYGKVTFNLWPSTMSTEKYQITITQNLVIVAQENNVKISQTGNNNLRIETTAEKLTSTNVAYLHVAFFDRSGFPLIPSVIILYNSAHQEVTRVTPILNYYYFDLETPGTYSIEGYIEDMLIGTASNINAQLGQTVSRAVNVGWTKEPLKVTVYYADGVAPLTSAKVSVFSWNGYRQVFTLRYTENSDINGQVNFSVWPTTLPAEKYRIIVTYGSTNVGQNDQIKVDRAIGAKISIITLVDLSNPDSGGQNNNQQPLKFSPTENGFNFINSLPKTAVGYTEAMNAMNSPSWANTIPPGLQPVIAIISISVNEHQMGNCFGMSYTAKYYYENPEEFSKKYPSYSNMYAVNQATVAPEIIINQFPGQVIKQPYYFNFLMLLLDRTSITDQVPWIIDQCNKNSPVLLNLIGHTIQNPTIYHSVLIYDFEQISNGVVFKIYDPNKPGETSYITLIKDSQNKFQLSNTGSYNDLCTKYGLEKIATAEFHSLNWATLSNDVSGLAKICWDLLPKSSLPFLGFRVDSPVTLLITAPNGSKVGYDQLTGKIVNEFSQVFYSGPNTEPQVVIIPNPDQTPYNISLCGTDNGDYTLTVVRSDNGTATSEPIVTTGKIVTGEIKQYALQLTETKPQIAEVKDKSLAEDYTGLIVAAFTVVIIVVLLLFVVARRRQMN